MIYIELSGKRVIYSEKYMPDLQTSDIHDDIYIPNLQTSDMHGTVGLKSDKHVS